jgi:anthranilate synthase component I
MIPDLKTFLGLAQAAAADLKADRAANSPVTTGAVIPVWKPVLADLLTPSAAYLRLARKAKHAFLLESIEGGERVARYTFLGTDPHLIVRARGEEIELWEHGKVTRRHGKVLDTLREIAARFRPVRVPATGGHSLPPFSAGAVGYIGYDVVGQFERVPAPQAAGATGLPDAVLMFFSNLLAFDHVKHQILIISNVHCDPGASRAKLTAAYRAAEKEIARMEKLLAAPVSAPRVGRKTRVKLKQNMTQPAFEGAIRKCKEYIAAGDIFQVVYSLRLEADLPADPFSVYRTLRTVNPSPYMFFLKMGDDVVLGSSPEMLVKVTGREVEYRPIAGTRRRGRDEAEDESLARELASDEKECAEHIMLVDLGRNDVGRVAEYGSVRVPPGGLMFVERYSHVMHLVSSVRGKLREGLDMFDAFASCFPAGTLSGAPKVRAMEIIHELEPTRRGIYGGAVLYMDYAGNLDSCIAIRTLVARGKHAYLQVGSGIVADSDPAFEYQECMNKSRALVRAIEEAAGV